MQHAIELHIEELVLHGFCPGDHQRITIAIQRELVQLFTERGVPPSLVQGGNVPQIDGGSFNVAPGSRAEAIGVQVAQALYRGLIHG